MMQPAPLAANRAPTWPRNIWIVRHGQSAGNAARDAAEVAGHSVIDLTTRDVDVPLSTVGEQQARALADFFAQLPPLDRPTTLLTSPYLRARRTAEIAMGAAGLALAPIVDERLREREFGWLDGLTRKGIAERFPEEAARRARLGKFYHRPPGGESWCDVFLRVRSFVSSLAIEWPGENVLIVAHQVVVLGFRYLIEQMTEHEILAVDASCDVANCAITSYALERTEESVAALSLRLFNHVAPVAQAGAPVTRRTDVASEEG